MNSAKIRAALGWRPRHTFDVGLEDTVKWYRDNGGWAATVRSGAYRDYYDQQYSGRLSSGHDQGKASSK